MALNRGSGWHWSDRSALPAALRNVEAELTCGAASQSNVLITGELWAAEVARLIHQLGPRSRGPFIMVECGQSGQKFLHDLSQPDGALSAATLADGGTLYLRDPDRLNPDGQASLVKLLNALQSMPDGKTGSHSRGIRLIVSTSVDLWKATASGQFRADLYYRLNLLHLVLPSPDETQEADETTWRRWANTPDR